MDDELKTGKYENKAETIAEILLQLIFQTFWWESYKKSIVNAKIQ